MDGLRKLAGLLQVRGGRLHPQHVGMGRIRQAARDRGLDPVLDAEEALRRALARAERAVPLVHVGRQQAGGQSVSAGDEDGGHACDVGRQARGHERAHKLGRRHQHLAPQVAALLLGRQLVLKVHARRAGLDHGLHQLVAVERAAKAGLSVGHDGRKPVALGAALGVLDLGAGIYFAR